MRRFFLNKEQIHSHGAILTGPDVRHIRTVLRLGAGDEIFLFDGKGSEYRARIMDSTPQQITLSILHQYSAVSESPVELTIAQALVKAPKMDRIVRQLTELGAFAFLPFMAQRSVPRPEPKRLAGRMRRWEAIARQALKQCGRSRPLHLGSVISFLELIGTSRSYDLSIIYHNEQPRLESRFCLAGKRGIRNVLALVGPEGGFTDEEVALARRSGFTCASLGPRILKSDTAAIAVATIFQHSLGDIGSGEKSLDKD
jgi:16S rRNA (uracil1498-N3)-methyltransferase